MDDLIPTTSQTEPGGPVIARATVADSHMRPVLPESLLSKDSSHQYSSTPNTPLSCSIPSSGAAINKNSESHITSAAPTKSSGQKRRKNLEKPRSSIHKPFRSPLRAGDSAPSLHKSSASTDVKRTSAVATGISTSSDINMDPLLPEPEPEVASRQYKQIERRSPYTSIASVYKRQGLGIRRPFRPPIAREDQAVHTNDSDYGRLLKIQALQSRIMELQSSIRKGRQILTQQEKADTPLEDLIAKWQKASQEGAQVLLEKYLEQEQVFGDNTWDDGNPRSDAFASNWGYSVTSSLSRRRPSLGELSPEHLQAVEERMESQDVQEDLPTVEEAIQGRCLPGTDTTAPTPMTKMQRLLMGLGIDPQVIGYNAEQDAFTTEEISYTSS
ncbi:hypothetical protein BC939DRAFT_179439 [Gamsiella multidivaricata]|uniref:uncharacterized protein n=1 Tax=Gamsiella multidivaricata TaxID=101098 RepID=UPI00221E7A60|nr:uncharacterized protein BC939DRAFT_179439 [Gamsiella multidivaricata]KAI7822550.1 hypothetical protein BC939DRAFT_179439 [Gamsiella multidivaricata]